MKIVKNGIRYGQDVEFSCDHCGCVFIANKYEYRREFSTRNELFFRSICPQCERPCIIAEEDETK